MTRAEERGAPALPIAPLVLALAAPLAVVTTLAAGALWWTFALYHLICLALPAVDSARRGIGRGAHLRLLGVAGPRGRGGVAAGLALAPVFAAAALGALALALARGWLPPGERIAGVLGSWGASPSRLPLVTALLVAGNGPAEELFWRGWVQGRLREAAGPRVAIALAAVLYASYHVYTLARLLGGPALAVAGAALVVTAAGLVWGRLREATGSVWPAVIGHAAVTAAYVAGYWLWLAPAAR